MTAGLLVEVDACQLCRSTRHELMFEEPPFAVRRCAQCGLVFVTPRLSEQELRTEVYGEPYWKSARPREQGYADYARDEALYLKTFRRRWALVARYRPRPGRVLDVGCAAGYFLRVMQEKGWDGRGIEPSASIAAHAQRHLGERVFVGTLDEALAADAALAPGSFDLVTMWDVVEHVPDPQRLLRLAHGLLKPDGVLILETQNVASAFAGLLGRRWHHYKHREHLYHFGPTTVRALLEQAGFAVERRTAAYGGKYVSFAFIAERAARLHAVLAWLLKPLALLGRAHVYVNLGDEMVVVARPLARPRAETGPAPAAVGSSIANPVRP